MTFRNLHPFSLRMYSKYLEWANLGKDLEIVYTLCADTPSSVARDPNMILLCIDAYDVVLTGNFDASSLSASINKLPILWRPYSYRKNATLLSVDWPVHYKAKKCAIKRKALRGHASCSLHVLSGIVYRLLKRGPLGYGNRNNLLLLQRWASVRAETEISIEQKSHTTLCKHCPEKLKTKAN